MMAVHDVQHRTLQVEIDSGSDMLSVMLFVLVAEVMIGQHGHIKRLVRNVFHHGQFGIFLREPWRTKAFGDKGLGLGQTLQQFIAFLFQSLTGATRVNQGR